IEEQFIKINMFKLEYLGFEEHPQLRNLELYFLESGEIKESVKPYTTIIIGPNGTGKSFILKEIAEIFRQFQEITTTNKKPAIAYSFHIRYFIGDNHFEIVSRKISTISNSNGEKKQVKIFRYFKNRPIDEKFDTDNFPFEKD